MNGPPTGQRQDAHVDHGVGRPDRHVDEVEDGVLRFVPPGQRVGAGTNVGDAELAVGVALAGPDDGVADSCIAEAGQRDPGSVDRLVDHGALKSAPDLAGQTAHTARGGHIDLDEVDNALDGGGSVQGPVRDRLLKLAARIGPHRGIRRRNVAEDDGRERFAGDDELGVQAGGAFHDPRVPVVVAFERGGLDPAGTIRRRDRQRVAVRADVGDPDLAFDDGAGRCGRGGGRTADQHGALEGVVRTCLAGADDERRDAAARHHAGWHVGRRAAPGRVVRLHHADVLAVAHDIAGAQAAAGFAQRAAIDVGRHFTERVGDVPLEAGEAMLGRQVGSAVDRRDVLEDGGLNGRVGQRRGLQIDRHQAVGNGDSIHEDGRARHREVLAVEFVAFGQHRDQVAAVRHSIPVAMSD